MRISIPGYAQVTINSGGPEIIINGVLLTDAQASSIRVAVANMLTDLADPEFMADLGEIGPLYRSRLSEVQRVMFDIQEDEA